MIKESGSLFESEGLAAAKAAGAPTACHHFARHSRHRGRQGSENVLSQALHRDPENVRRQSQAGGRDQKLLCGTRQEHFLSLACCLCFV